MEVSIHHQEGMKFEAKTSKSSFIINPEEITPVEIFAAGMISCSGSDMIALPKKQGFDVKNLSIKSEVVRNEEPPRKFNEIHLTYTFDSTADATTAKHWVLASIETYCSTINTVRDTSHITYTIIYNGETVADREEIISGGGSTPDFGEIEACET
jgi:putative redox protein